MLAKLALGAEIDIATSGEVAASSESVLNFLRNRNDPKPTYNVFPVAAPMTSPFTGYLTIGAPPIGRAWNVLGLALAGIDDITQSSAGGVGLYIGSPPVSGLPPLAQLRVPRLAVPSYQAFPHRTTWCMSNDAVYLYANGLTIVSTQLTAVLWVAEWRETDIFENSGR